MILDLIKERVDELPEQVALLSGDSSITYKELWDKSDRLAGFISENVENKKPIIVYGHKSVNMIVCFLACVKSGHAYVPLDISMANDRVQEIKDLVDNDFILSTVKTDIFSGEDLFYDDFNIETSTVEVTEDNWVNPNDTFYIIFTSGSTGKPKGVQISSENLTNFVNWSMNLGSEGNFKKKKSFLNQAPFSFDLSVMDLYTSLASGGRLCILNKEVQKDSTLLMKRLEDYNVDIWVSTPSFVELCLADSKFNEDLIPNMEIFLFCGEKLSPKTALSLKNRFPRASVINTYGPTESTVAVTGVEITKDIAQNSDYLPIGIAKEGTEIEIWNEDGKVLNDDEIGEIVILGDTVSSGYFQDKSKTDEVFGQKDGKRFYRTGDAGYLHSEMLYYKGRIDFQIKMHGYRIELGDIEKNMLKLDGVDNVCVLPYSKQDVVKYLIAFVVSNKLDNDYETRKSLRNQLKELLPDYMVPKKIQFIEKMPITNNGKIDRRKLMEMV